jgi:DNA primase
MALSFSEAKRIPIVDYLLEAGFEPARIKGNDYWYYSPFRHERTPSLKVNTKLNVWYDHGSGEGGTIIDIGMRIHQCSRIEFLDKLSRGNLSNSIQAKTRTEHVKESKLEIVSSNDLTNEPLLSYLKNRGIKTHFGQQHCKEVEFRIGSKNYEAIGFPNRSGGFELRNRWFKGSSSPKDISFIDNGSEHLCVTEGFIDFLSILTLNQQKDIQLPVNSNFLILNSLSFIGRSVPILEAHKSNQVFLDNDLAGRQAKETLNSKGIEFFDQSSFYKSYKDVNDYLMKDPTARSTLTRPKGIRL